jgi:hypothetical protein
MLSEVELLKICNDSTHAAVKEIIVPLADAGACDNAIMVVLEGVVAAVLLALNGNDKRKAAAFLEEALVPGVIERIARSDSKSQHH